MSEINFLEGIKMDFQFLDSLIPPVNPELGRNLKQLLMDLWKVDSCLKSNKEDEMTVEEGIPHHLPLKLCILGRKYAGKRTVAKQIQELY